MQWSNVRAAARRVDVQLAAVIGGGAAVLCSLLLCGLLAFAILESIESTGLQLEDAAADIAASLRAGQRVPEPWWLRRAIVYRVVDEDGRIAHLQGVWPAAPARVHESASLRAALGAGADDYLAQRTGLGDDRVVEVAMPLRGFTRERSELLRAAAAIVPVGLVGALAFGLIAARHALRPVRRTAAAMHDIDARRLDVRLQTRGTTDDLDRLVTAINEVLARLAWVFARLSQFSADVAHELRTPLNRVLSMVEVALIEGRRDTETDALLERVCASVLRMQGSVEALLLLARGEEGRLRVTYERVELGQLVEDLVELYRPLAEEGAQRLEGERQAAYVSIDRQLVTRAVANLLDNALRYSGSGAAVRAGLRAGDGKVVLTIEDSGPGIPIEERERVFERFVRLDGASGSAGAGLGLAISRMVARLHGGDLWVEDSALGGAAFHLTLAATTEA